MLPWWEAHKARGSEMPHGATRAKRTLLKQGIAEMGHKWQDRLHPLNSIHLLV